MISHESVLFGFVSCPAADFSVLQKSDSRTLLPTWQLHLPTPQCSCSLRPLASASAWERLLAQGSLWPGGHCCVCVQHRVPLPVWAQQGWTFSPMLCLVMIGGCDWLQTHKCLIWKEGRTVAKERMGFARANSIFSC